MKPTFLATVTGVLLAASFCAQAGPSAPARGPSDPGAPVPALAYDSALRGYARFSADASATPDKAWRRANDTVAGHGGGDRQHEQADGHGSAPAPASAHSEHHPTRARQ